MIAVLVPTLYRADRLKAVYENIVNSDEGINCYFIAEPFDTETIDKLIELGYHFFINRYEPCYSGAIQTAYEDTTEEYLLNGMDDCDFKKGWATIALKCFDDPRVMSVGVNDLHNPDVLAGLSSTIFLVKRAYIQKQSGVIDMTNRFLYPYKHNYTDTEFFQTAMKRGVFKVCLDSVIEHLHWAWGKAEIDKTYQLGIDTNEEDRITFEERRHLWQ